MAVEQPYASSLEHLLDEFARIDRLVRGAALRARDAAGDDAFRGLSISDDDVAALVARPFGRPFWEPVPPEPEALAAVERRRDESLRRGVPLRLAALATGFGLSRFDLDAILLALAPELDLKYERLFAYLNDDVTRRRPAVDTALSLLCPDLPARLAARARFSPVAPLLRHGLLNFSVDRPERRGSLLGASFCIDERIAAHLLGGDDLDERLLGHARCVTPRLGLGDLRLPEALRVKLAGLAGGRSPAPIVAIEGPRGAGKKAVAGAICKALGRGLLVVDGRGLAHLTAPELGALARCAAREAVLRDAALCWDRLDASGVRGGLAAVLGAFEGLSGLGFITLEGPWDTAEARCARPLVHLTLGALGTADRAALWEAWLGAPAGVDLAPVVQRYRMTAGQIRDAAGTAQSLARFRDPERGEVTAEDLSAACKMEAAPKLGELARKVEALASWDDLVLPTSKLTLLRAIGEHARHRALVFEQWGFDRKLTTGKGLGVLFSGPPGTGKTMAAGVLAREIGLELYAIDLSAVVSKYIGETEKHLARVFAEAEGSSAVLFFDEADALFGKRTEVRDAHDRYANVETSYLLQRIDSYEGVVILASNHSRNMDEAFVRRLRFVVEFPGPGEVERRRIWERVFPQETPREAGLDWGAMARRFELSGGSIRNIALAAAFLAAGDGGVVGRRHILQAVRREYEKMGKVVDEGTFGEGLIS